MRNWKNGNLENGNFEETKSGRMKIWKNGNSI